MAVVNINTIKNWFKTGMIPTQAQFWSVFDSYRHKNDNIPVAEVEGINELLATRASQQVLDNHLAQKGAPNGYAPLDEFTKLAAQYLNIVNDLVTGGATALLSAEQGKVLQTQVNAINTLLTSDNVNLDTVQELVDAIETVQMSLSTILVNDLTTGGTTKALTAEMGKQLDLIKESTANKSTSIAVDYLSNIKFPSVKAVYDFCMLAFKKKFLAFGDVPGITHTFGMGSENTMFKFSNNNPITATIPTNATTPFDIGTVFETIATGNGALTVTGAAGVTILTNLSNTSVKNEVRRYTKIDTDTWTVEGNVTSLSANQSNVFTVLQKFGLGSFLVDDETSTATPKKLWVRSSPSNTVNTNPRMFDFVASGRDESPGWFGGINFFSKNNTNEVLMMDLKTASNGVVTAIIYGNLAVNGTFAQSLVNLTRNSNSILNAGTYNALTYNINGIVSGPFRIVEDRVQAGGGSGWHAKRIFYVKSNNDSTDRIAIELISQDNGIPLINLPGIVKPNQMDLSALGSYVNDAAAATGGVPIGYGYVNSSTGTVQRRLT